jgi:hypothetical protein
MDIATITHYKPANFLWKITCIVGVAKKTNFTKFGRITDRTVHAPDLKISLFC